MKTLSIQQIQIINARRSAKVGDRYLDSDGNIWVGQSNGRLIVPPQASQINQPGYELNIEQRIEVLEAEEPTPPTPPSSSVSEITGTAELIFGSEEDSATVTIPSLLLTVVNFKGFSVIPTQTTQTSLDDFKLNGVTFSIENIVDGVSFDIRASAQNNATGTYTVIYKVIYS